LFVSARGLSCSVSRSSMTSALPSCICKQTRGSCGNAPGHSCVFLCAAEFVPCTGAVQHAPHPAQQRLCKEALCASLAQPAGTIWLCAGPQAGARAPSGQSHSMHETLCVVGWGSESRVWVLNPAQTASIKRYGKHRGSWPGHYSTPAAVLVRCAGAASTPRVLVPTGDPRASAYVASSLFTKRLRTQRRVCAVFRSTFSAPGPSSHRHCRIRTDLIHAGLHVLSRSFGHPLSPHPRRRVHLISTAGAKWRPQPTS
jgi:hypothetical protein